MELQTISTVSKKFNISTRTLRYYEKIGLLQSVRKDGYAYRTYDENSLIKLEQIIILRKLRIPLKEIKLILQNQEASIAIQVFEKKINEISSEMSDGSNHGYERWITIPDDMQVTKPFEKKQFAGGLYAAHTIAMGNFEEWKLLCDWVQNNAEYEPDWKQQCFEEHLNYINLYSLDAEKQNNRLQLDLLIPIKAKQKE